MHRSYRALTFRPRRTRLDVRLPVRRGHKSWPVEPTLSTRSSATTTTRCALVATRIGAALSAASAQEDRVGRYAERDHAERRADDSCQVGGHCQPSSPTVPGV